MGKRARPSRATFSRPKLAGALSQVTQSDFNILTVRTRNDAWKLPRDTRLWSSVQQQQETNTMLPPSLVEGRSKTSEWTAPFSLVRRTSPKIFKFILCTKSASA